MQRPTPSGKDTKNPEQNVFSANICQIASCSGIFYSHIGIRQLHFFQPSDAAHDTCRALWRQAAASTALPVPRACAVYAFTFSTPMVTVSPLTFHSLLTASASSPTNASARTLPAIIASFRATMPSTFSLPQTETLM